MRNALDPAALVQIISTLDRLVRALDNSRLPVDTSAIREAAEELARAHTFLRWHEETYSWRHLVN
jgi:hypothetical protein